MRAGRQGQDHVLVALVGDRHLLRRRSCVSTLDHAAEGQRFLVSLHRIGRGLHREAGGHAVAGAVVRLKSDGFIVCARYQPRFRLDIEGGRAVGGKRQGIRGGNVVMRAGRQGQDHVLVALVGDYHLLRHRGRVSAFHHAAEGQRFLVSLHGISGGYH